MHIGFGQNTVSSLYGHQKGDHMKTIELSHKKHKANESQEKMTVTSGKDVCRRIGHSDEADGENQENAYIHDRFALDAVYALCTFRCCNIVLIITLSYSTNSHF
jgi:hypothetical protein